MPGLVALVDLLSLDVTRGLVLAGLGLGFDATNTRWTNQPNPATGLPWASMAITGATNASPIVLTTALPHGVQPGRALHAVISGVLGNTAANNLDAAAQSDTRGEALAVVASYVDATRLSLSAVNPTDTPSAGFLAPLAGNGAYAGGGTLTTALTDGKILLGREHVAELSAPPRIVFVPFGADWEDRDIAHRRPVSVGKSTEQRLQASQRAIANEAHQFEVHVWGQAIPADPAADFDATQVVYQQIFQSAHAIAHGQWKASRGAWSDQREAATQLGKAGHEFVLTLAIDTPVLDAALPYVPHSTAGSSSIYLQPADGSTPELAAAGL